MFDVGNRLALRVQTNALFAALKARRSKHAYLRADYLARG